MGAWSTSPLNLDPELGSTDLITPWAPRTNYSPAVGWRRAGLPHFGGRSSRIIFGRGALEDSGMHRIKGRKWGKKLRPWPEGH